MNISPEMILLLPVLFFSIVCHEFAHGYAALQGGDDTAKLAGRLTFNPLAHIDLWGTIIVPGLLLLSHSGFMFGWAKPVPVNPRNLRSAKWDLVVSLAGVGANLVLALSAAFILKVALLLNLVSGETMNTGGFSVSQCIAIMLKGCILINLVLIAFNLIPIPPLDGSHVFFYFIRVRDSVSFQVFQFLESYGFFLIVILIYTDVLGRYYLWPVIATAMRVISFVFQIRIPM
jgi:Zn-dependent protease